MKAVRSLAVLAFISVQVPGIAAAQPAAQAAAAPMRFGYVNTERLLREASPAVRAQRKLEAEFKKRDDELAKMAEQLKRQQEDIDKNAVTMGEAQRRTREREFGELNREFQRKQREFREDLNQRRNEEMAQLIELAQRVIRQIGDQEKYDIILTTPDVVFTSARVDITDKVIKALDAAKPPAK